MDLKPGASLRRLLLSFCVVFAFISSKTNADTDINHLAATWDHFVTLCGRILQDPYATINATQNDGRYDVSDFGETPDGRLLSGSVSLSSEAWISPLEISVALARHSEFEVRECSSANLRIVNAKTPVAAASRFIEAVQTYPNVEIVGGRLSPTRSPYYHFSLLRVWEETDATVRVVIDENLFYIFARYVAPAED